MSHNSSSEGDINFNIPLMDNLQVIKNINDVTTKMLETEDEIKKFEQCWLGCMVAT